MNTYWYYTYLWSAFLNTQPTADVGVLRVGNEELFPLMPTIDTLEKKHGGNAHVKITFWAEIAEPDYLAFRKQANNA